MILHYKNIFIHEEKISFKKKIHYSNHFSYIPIKYNHTDFIIQTPTMFIPFNIKIQSNNKKCLFVSFQNTKDIDTKNFINNCLNTFFFKTYKKYSNYYINNFIKKNKVSDYMIFKVPDYCLFFDQNKNLINTFTNMVSGSFIIQLSGLWIQDKSISFDWNLLQAQINVPIKINNFIIVQKKIPPPPPLPPKKKRYIIKNINI